LAIEAKIIRVRGTNELSYRSNIKDNKFNIGETFSDDEVIKIAY